MEVIERERLADNARAIGGWLEQQIQQLIKKYPTVLQHVRGLGLMLGIELAAVIPNLGGEASKTQSARMAMLLHHSGLLAIPAGAQVLRFLPPLNLKQSEAEEALGILESVCRQVA